jgi:hypothetical protein
MSAVVPPETIDALVQEMDGAQEILAQLQAAYEQVRTCARHLRAARPDA